MLHTENGKEFVNNTLSSWLDNRGIRHVLGGKYQPQSQGAVESFNKTIQRFLNEAFTNSIFNWEENKWSLPLMIADFLLYYNNKFKHSTTKMTPREVLFNYKNKEMIEKVIINTEKSMKNFIQEIDYDVGDSLLITSWLLELPKKN